MNFPVNPITHIKNKTFIGFVLVLFLALGICSAQDIYEAEDALLSDGANISSEHAGASGAQYVQGYLTVGAKTAFTVSAPAAGFFDVTLRYGNGYGNSSLSVYVNGVKALVTALPTTGAWAAWLETSETLLLKAGSNTILYTYENGDGGNVNLDRITVAPTVKVQPDLQITQITWTPAEPLEGEPVTFSAVITNKGTSPASGNGNCAAFSVNGHVVSLSAAAPAAIAVGGTAAVTGQTPWTSSFGVTVISAQADPDNLTAELHESNNTLIDTISFGRKPGPDLVISAIRWMPSNPSEGSAVTFQLTIMNQGLDAAAGPDNTAVVTVNGTTALSGTFGALAAGAQVDVAVSGTWAAAKGSNTISAAVDPGNKVAESFEGNNSASRSLFIGRGASVPWVEYEAEDGIAGGGAEIIGPSRDLGTWAGEASGRQAAMLDAAGEYIQWVAGAPANSIVLRVCIPDAPGGGGIDATLSLYVNDVHAADLDITSRHAWIYGDDAFQNDSPGPGARKIYTEAHLLFKGFAVAAGDRVKLMKDAGDAAPYYSVDLIDLEQVGAPVPKPEGYISITDAGPSWDAAIPDDDISDDNAISSCIRFAESGGAAGVYIPEGTFIQSDKYIVSGAKIQGAGMWYSKIFCPSKNEDAGWGQTGFNVNADGSEFRDFAIFGWGGTRTQGGKVWVNSARKNTVIERMWVENVQCAYWVGGNQESTNLLVRDCRFRNTGADAINLCNGNLDGLVDNCHARNTGDDAFAIWSAKDLYSQPCTNNLIRNCTVQVTWRAACFAVYGGVGNRVENCVGSDAITYPGLTVSSEFEPFPMESATIDGLTLYRCGGHYFSGYPWEADYGAIWLRADLQGTNGITIRNVDVIDPTYQGIQFQGSGTFTNTLLENITISNPGTIMVEVKAGLGGGAEMRNISLAGNRHNAEILVNGAEDTFELVWDGPNLVRTSRAASPLERHTLSLSGSVVTMDIIVPRGMEEGLTHVGMSVYAPDGKAFGGVLNENVSPGSYRFALDIGARKGRGGKQGVGVCVVTVGSRQTAHAIMF